MRVDELFGALNKDEVEKIFEDMSKQDEPVMDWKEVTEIKIMMEIERHKQELENLYQALKIISKID